MTPDTIGDVLTALRISKGWSQTELAKRSGVARTYISLIENNYRQADIALSTLIKLFEPFGMYLHISFVPSEPPVAPLRGKRKKG